MPSEEPWRFPSGFLWGSATAAHQVEGDNHNSDWWVWERAPDTRVAEPSGIAIDHYRRYREDIALLSSLGHNALRISVEWARIEPSPGEFDADAVRHYRSVLACMQEYRLTPLVTLHHFTLPLWFARQGGWLAPDAVALFRRYAVRVADALGDLTPYVCTINEPQIVALHGFRLGCHPPGIRDAEAWRRVGRVLRAAHESACDVLAGGPKCGLCVALPAIEVARPGDPRSERLAAELERETVDLYLDDLAGDFVGVQYYSPWRIDAEMPHLLAAAPDGERVTQMGWEIRPDGLRAAIGRAARTGLPVIVTENGIATTHDCERVAYLRAHVAAVAAAIKEGAAVRGYLYWSSFDNFEWQHGFAPQFGLVGIDRDDGLRRTVRPSAHLFAEIAASNSLPATPRARAPARAAGPAGT